MRTDTSATRDLSIQPTRIRRRFSPHIWHQLKGQVDREYRALSAIDPNNPRVRPSLSSVGWGRR
jgi:hypothetical protein